ncbi:MAG: cupin domain-containing protein [Pseudomonadota bacterium]
MTDTPTKLLFTADALAGGAFGFRHPLDATVRCTITPVSRLAGLHGAAINLVHIAPNETAFPFHRHHAQEEWAYVLSGRGEVRLDAEHHTIGPGDFVTFPPGGPAHAMRNTGEEVLICLMGGDATPTDVIDFPELGHRAIRDSHGYASAPEAAFVPLFPGASPAAPKEPL